MMKKSFIITLALIGIAHNASANALEAIEFQVSRQGDLELSCGQLSEEAVLMRDIITTTQDIKTDSEMKGHGISAAGALGSFLVGTATGGIGIAAAGFLLDKANEQDADSADGVQDIAKQRRTLMMGIYNAKGCEGPIEHAMQDNIQENTSLASALASIEPASGDDKFNYNE